MCLSLGRLHYAKLNVIFGLIGKMLLMSLEFISRAVFIKFLGEELLGINGVFTNILQVLSLAELGMNNVVCFSFYKPLAKNDRDKLSSLIHFYKKIYNSIALAVVVIGLLILPLIPYLIKTSLELQNVRGIYLIFLADTVFSYLFVYKLSLIRADQRGYEITKYEMVSNVIRTVLQVVSLYLFKSIVLYLFIKVIISVLTNAICAKKVDNEYPYINQTCNDLTKDEKKSIFEVVKSGFIYKLSAILLNSTDNILISMICGTVWVGYLSNYITIIGGLGSIYTIIFNNITASVGNLIETEKSEKRLSVFNIMLMISGWIAIVFSICLYCLSDDFITLWIGSKFIMDKSIVLAKAIMLFLSCSLQPLFSYREALGLYQKTKYAMLLAAVINVALSIIMGVKWGIAGILYASIIAMLSTYVWYEPVVLYRECFDVSSMAYFKLRIKDLLLCIVGLFLFDKLFVMFVVTSWVGWILKCGIVFFATNVFCLFVYGNSNEIKYCINEVKNKFYFSKKVK